VRISMVSRKPSVVIKAVFAPRRSISALVASVVPWITWPITAGVTPAFSQTCCMPSMMAFSGAE